MHGHTPVEGGAGDGQVVEAALDQGAQPAAAGVGAPLVYGPREGGPHNNV